jgi:DNA-binding IclR family transcriptional regulator
MGNLLRVGLVDGTVFHHMRVVKSQINHCLKLLSIMADVAHGMRVSDLARQLAAPKSSTQRLLEHLMEQGWVEQDTTTGLYRLTMRLAILGQRYLSSAGITDAAQAILDRLSRETRELARVTVVGKNQLSWICSAQGAPPGLRYDPSMGAPIVSYATANGKAWLATLSDTEAAAIARADGLGKRRDGLGPRALTSEDALLAELKSVRRRGYAVADEEAEPGIKAIAVAILNPGSKAAIGTVSVAGPKTRMTADRHAAVVAALRRTAVELSLAWPYPAPERKGNGDLAIAPAHRTPAS